MLKQVVNYILTAIACIGALAWTQVTMHYLTDSDQGLVNCRPMSFNVTVYHTAILCRSSLHSLVSCPYLGGNESGLEDCQANFHILHMTTSKYIGAKQYTWGIHSRYILKQDQCIIHKNKALWTLPVEELFVSGLGWWLTTGSVQYSVVPLASQVVKVMLSDKVINFVSKCGSVRSVFSLDTHILAQAQSCFIIGYMHHQGLWCSIISHCIFSVCIFAVEMFHTQLYDL